MAGRNYNTEPFVGEIETRDAPSLETTGQEDFTERDKRFDEVARFRNPDSMRSLGEKIAALGGIC